MSLKHHFTNPTVVRVLHGVNPVPYFLHALIGINRRCRDKGAAVIFILLRRNTDTVAGELRSAAIGRDLPAHLDHMADLADADGARIIPIVSRNKTGAIRYLALQVRSAVGRSFGRGILENIKAFDHIADLKVRNFNIMQHAFHPSKRIGFIINDLP